MRSQKGFSLSEVLTLASVATLAVTATAMRTLPGLAVDDTQLAAGQLYTYMQFARVEAVGRERVCTLQVDARRQMLRVTDSVGTADVHDDVVLHEAELSRRVRFVDTDRGPTAQIHDVLEASFDGRGRAGGPARSVGVSDGKASWRLSVLPNGELRRERWDGSSWIAGS